MMRTLIFLTVILFSCTQAQASQLVGGDFELLYEIPDPGFASIGNAVSDAGDVNGDGFDDIIIGADWADPGGRWNAGTAYVLSGPTGAILHQFDGAAGHDRFGNSVSGAGDVDGDGMADVIVGAWTADPAGMTNAGSAYVYSGATGNLLHRFDGESDYAWLGYCVSGAGDVDADGFADLLVGSYGASANGRYRSGSVFVYSGLTGAELYRFDGALAGDELGRSVSDAGDVNADGYADFIVGAPAAAPIMYPWQGTVTVHSGLDGSILYDYQGWRSYTRFGMSVTGVGDMDLDGYDDFLIGEPGRTVPNWWEDIEGAGMAYVYSGATGAEIQRFEGNSEAGWLGYSVSGTGDVDGDGVPDCLVGSAFERQAELFSGRTGKVLKEFFFVRTFGFALSGAGDVDGDGHADLVLGAGDHSFYGIPREGGVQVFRITPFLYADSKEISLAGGATIQLDLNFPEASAADPYRVLFSTGGPGPTSYGVEIPLTRGILLADSYAGIYPFTSYLDLQGTLDPFGNANASFVVQGGMLPSRLLGRSLWMAAVAMDPGLYPNLSSIAIRLHFVL